MEKLLQLVRYLAGTCLAWMLQTHAGGAQLWCTVCSHNEHSKHGAVGSTLKADGFQSA
jgi:hypothetical protein